MDSILHRLLGFYNGLTPVELMCFWGLVKIAIVVGVVQGIVAYAVLAERKISAWIQDRVGPNRTALPFVQKVPLIGPFLVGLGIFQPIADGLKFILKEDFTPAHVRKVYFSLAP